jgi:hypothetical protein
MKTLNIGLVEPCNDIQQALSLFDTFHDDIKTQNMVLTVASHGAKEIEFVECPPGKETGELLLWIDQQGYMPAPTPYILGLGSPEHSLLVEALGYILGLDMHNLVRKKDGEPCFITTNYVRRTGRILSIAKSKGYWMASGWYLAIIKKESGS